MVLTLVALTTSRSACLPGVSEAVIESGARALRGGEVEPVAGLPMIAVDDDVANTASMLTPIPSSWATAASAGP